MGKQTGLLQFEGKVGNLCFYKTADGYLVRRNSSISAKRIKTAPAYARTRENMSEFAHAARTSKLFRKAFASLIERGGDKRATNALMRMMTRVLQHDELNPRGQRNVSDGQLKLLEGFEFSEKANLGNTLCTEFSGSIDRETGEMVIDVPEFKPANSIIGPEGATHFRLFAGGAAIDFKDFNFDVATSESACLLLKDKKQKAVRLVQSVTPGGTSPMFLLLGIEFLQLVNGKETAMTSGNALAVVRVSDQ